MNPRLPEGGRDLTERQREVARLVVAGLTNAEIGERLGISLDGAKYHVSEILARLNLDRRDQIAQWVGRGEPPRRWFRALLGLPALAAAGATTVVLAAVLVGVSLGRAPSLDATPEPASLILLPSEERAAKPTPVAPLDDRKLLERPYRPAPWSATGNINRTPPHSLDFPITE